MPVLAILPGCFQNSRDKRTAPAPYMAGPRGGEVERQATGTGDLQYWLSVKLVWSWWAAGRSFSVTGELLRSQSELLFHPPNLCRLIILNLGTSYVVCDDRTVGSHGERHYDPNSEVKHRIKLRLTAASESLLIPLPRKFLASALFSLYCTAGGMTKFGIRSSRVSGAAKSQFTGVKRNFARI